MGYDKTTGQKERKQKGCCTIIINILSGPKSPNSQPTSVPLYQVLPFLYGLPGSIPGERISFFAPPLFSLGRACQTHKEILRDIPHLCRVSRAFPSSLVMWLSPTRPGFKSRLGNSFFNCVDSGYNYVCLKNGEKKKKSPRGTRTATPRSEV